MSGTPRQPGTGAPMPTGIRQTAARAASLVEQGRADEALPLYETLCRLEPGNADAWMRRGVVNGMLNRHRAAADCCRRALELAPDSPEARLNLANALLQCGLHEEAALECERLARSAPGAPVAWFLLGRSRAELDQLDEAAEAYRRALQLQPGHPQASFGLGYVLHRLGRWEEALEHFREALRSQPGMAQAHWGLGMSLQMLGRLDEALEHHRRAAALNPRHAGARIGIGTVLSLQGHQDQAVASFREAIALEPDNTDARLKLAANLMPLGQPDEAQRLVDQVLEMEPDNVEAVTLAATIDQHRGDIERSRRRIEPLLAAGVEEINLALAWAAVCKSGDQPEKAIKLLERQLRREHGLTATGRRNAHFALGRLYDAGGDYARAFEHYRRGNELKGASFDPAQREAQTDATIEVFSATAMDSLPRASLISDRPVFVIGMPRSGTSLIEQILASHPQVYGAGELLQVIHAAGSMHTRLGKKQPYPACLPQLQQGEIDGLARDYLQHIEGLAPEARRVVDKMPGNFMYLGLIDRLFPGARVIHSMRDPLDTCLSCYFQDFSRSHPYSYDLRHLGAFYRSYRRLMEHWRTVLRIPMLEVQYEELVEDQEGVSRRMLEFCGLEWDEHCRDFHRTRRYVATASYDQVRRPLYRSSVARWKNYAEFLGPLREALELPEST
ncbi:MAG TPA: sulfotransferase family protein [Gammaproteobacteria bacterium]|nr:sulfotransferase family protein [Gammaproteobacteria bacterium]